MESEADADDAAAGDLVGQEWLAVFTKVVETGSDRVPVECGIVKISSEYVGDVGAEVEEEVNDSVVSY